MKKITRKNLDELEKEMPVICESEQNDHLGKAFYIDYNGNAYGQIGIDTFYVLGSRQLYDYAVEHHLDVYGIFLYELDDEKLTGLITPLKGIQKKVFTKYAKEVIKYNGKISLVKDSYAKDIYYDANTKELCFNTYHSGEIFGVEGLTRKLREADKDIQADASGHIPGGGGTSDRIQQRINEIMAIIAEYNKKEAEIKDRKAMVKLHNETVSDRKRYADELYSLWIEQGHTGYGYNLWDAEDKCGAHILYA